MRRLRDIPATLVDYVDEDNMDRTDDYSVFWGQRCHAYSAYSCFCWRNKLQKQSPSSTLLSQSFVGADSTNTEKEVTSR